MTPNGTLSAESTPVVPVPLSLHRSAPSSFFLIDHLLSTPHPHRASTTQNSPSSVPPSSVAAPSSPCVLKRSSSPPAPLPSLSDISSSDDNETESVGNETSDDQLNDKYRYNGFDNRKRKVRRSRTTFTTFQLHQLEKAFAKVIHLDCNEMITFTWSHSHLFLASLPKTDPISWCIHTRKLGNETGTKWGPSSGKMTLRWLVPLSSVLINSPNDLSIAILTTLCSL